MERLHLFRGGIHKRTRSSSNSCRAIRSSKWVDKLLTEDVKTRYADLKQASADRSQRLLGTIVKRTEVQFHHDVYNQYLWNMF